MLFKRYKCLTMVEDKKIEEDEHNCYEEVWNVFAYNNKKKKGKPRIVAKVIKDSYGRVFRVYIEEKARNNKDVQFMLDQKIIILKSEE